MATSLERYIPLTYLHASLQLHLGRIRILTPAGESWDSWFDGDTVSPGFMPTRNPAADQEREGV
jgi:virulence-associated protein VagC